MEEQGAEVANPEWRPVPFGDFLAFMSQQGVSEWVWPLIEACARHGVFHSDSSRCILARPVNSAIPIDTLNALGDLDPATFPDRQLANRHDAWLIVFAGSADPDTLAAFFTLAPYDLPFLIWQRNGRDPVKRYPFNQVRKRIHGREATETPEDNGPRHHRRHGGRTGAQAGGA